VNVGYCDTSIFNHRTKESSSVHQWTPLALPNHQEQPEVQRQSSQHCQRRPILPIPSLILFAQSPPSTRVGSAIKIIFMVQFLIH
jgi:hypothetical protein